MAPFKSRGATHEEPDRLTAIAVFTVATAVAGKPGAFATDKAIAAAKSKPVMMAEQQLPFDRAALEELTGPSARPNRAD
jgi:hypothetical protein